MNKWFTATTVGEAAAAARELAQSLREHATKQTEEATAWTNEAGRGSGYAIDFCLEQATTCAVDAIASRRRAAAYDRWAEAALVEYDPRASADEARQHIRLEA